MIGFSVLMSIYGKDSALDLRQSLDSLCNQSCQMNELILVIDGPIPGQLQVLVDEYSLKLNIITVVNQTNLGLGRALNNGLKRCNYPWVFRMDSDDICDKDRFKLQVEFIDQNPGVDVVGTWIDEFNSIPGDISSYRKVPSGSGRVREAMKSYSAVNHVTVALNKEAVLSAGGYRGGKNFQEDYDLWIRMISKGYLFDNIPIPLVSVRIGNDMLGRRAGWEYLMNEVKLHYNSFSLGLISFPRLILNIIIRIPTRLLPNNFRKFLYIQSRKYISK